MNTLKRNKIRSSRNNVATSLQTKTIKVTIGCPVSTGVNQVFTSVANKVEQGLQLTATTMIPILGKILYVSLVCDENFTGSAGDETSFSCKIGNASGGSQIKTAVNVADVGQSGEATPSTLQASLSVSSIYISATPTVNDWNQFTAGKLTFRVTYIDNNAV